MRIDDLFIHINASHESTRAVYPAISEGIDEDSSGFVSVHEVSAWPSRSEYISREHAGEQLPEVEAPGLERGTMARIVSIICRNRWSTADDHA